jgi:hypothetical protein
MRWRHRKRGSVYEALSHSALLQCSTAPEFEAAFKSKDWTVYRNIETGIFYIRPTEEFLDGRFERVDEW